MNKRKIILCLLIIIGIAFSVFCYHNSPTGNNGLFYPKCVIHYLTGLSCPSCGIQRALYSVLHGQFANAIRYNYMLIITIPYILLIFISEIFSLERIKEVLYCSKALYCYVAIYILWFIIRNIFKI